MPPAGPSPCPKCPGVITSSPEKPSGGCKCVPPNLWDGNSCVDVQNCTCMVGERRYAVQEIYEDNNCQTCVCTIGGIANCKPKLCPKCRPGLRLDPKEPCSCICQPCPTGTRLCPTDGVCVDEKNVCDGIQDCSDDEIDCYVSTTETTTTEYSVQTSPKSTSPWTTTRQPVSSSAPPQTTTTRYTTLPPTTPKRNISYQIIQSCQVNHISNFFSSKMSRAVMPTRIQYLLPYTN